MTSLYSAYAWKTGLIEFGRDVPDDALAFLHLDGELEGLFQELVETLADTGFAEGELLVPTVAETPSECSKLNALLNWKKLCFEPLSDRHHDGGVVITDAILEGVFHARL